MSAYFEVTTRLHPHGTRLVRRISRASAMLPLATAVLLVLSPVDSKGQTPRQPTRLAVSDIELGPHGQWSGRIVDAQGIGMGGLPLRLSNSRGVAAGVVTDLEGRFALSNLPAGVHLLDGSGTPRLYRFWKHGTAPPKAVSQSLIIAHGKVVRGVQGSRIYDWMSDHPGLTYTGIAAAIIVPVVVVGTNMSSSPASP